MAGGSDPGEAGTDDEHVDVVHCHARSVPTRRDPRSTDRHYRTVTSVDGPGQRRTDTPRHDIVMDRGGDGQAVSPGARWR
ncbi:hypothetical protein GCM10017556_55800 [Micromonospora sagamiensis]|nr:hypothetical protein GCM10017556_55800 [Micromonospora sagamiensis]